MSGLMDCKRLFALAVFLVLFPTAFAQQVGSGVRYLNLSDPFPLYFPLIAST